MDGVTHPTKLEERTLPSHDATAIGAVESVELMRGNRELLIRHGSSVYRLRVTASEKLILTK